MKFFHTLATLVFIFSAFSQAKIWATGPGVSDPRKAMEDSQKKIQGWIKSFPEKHTSKDEDELAAKIRGELEPLFAESQAAELVLRSQDRKKFNPAQKQELQTYLRKIITNKLLSVYNKKGEHAGKINQAKTTSVKIKSSRELNDSGLGVEKAIEVLCIVPGEEIDFPLQIMFLKPEKLEYLIYDVHFDGKSLLMSYRNQFATIIDKEGISSLLKKLKKIAETK